ncbi:hypothetical protein PV11_01210 [Exophiala sideris]|uniref:ML-like domain-containing protein n=1 Tax=Exophiala sideris TaxID=1016849 RepID=A0A0D1YSA2_9EURO|nr:hypothetical protein PV11_01210 [Exophiala sideris]
MARPARSETLFSWFSVCSVLVTFLSFSLPASASQNITWIQYTGNDGTVWLNDDRKPALYTQSFGDCQGDSLLNITRFDGAYYKDNMTVLFHLEGSSPLTNESLMLYIGVYAYGESRFDLTFNPCNANINSLCPLNSSIPIMANGIIPVAQSDVANIPSIALTIPDFEGEAILRIFANSTQSQIACFSAVLTNGASFSHPSAVGSVLGIFALIALVSSLAVSMYGQHVPEMRKHYAHSISIFVVFSVYQHIFFTGALSMNWPSVLVAFWSNYAWSAGIIYSQHMQNSINKFIGSNTGNISMVGAAPNGENANDLGGGYQISQIYKRAALPSFEPYEGTGATFRPNELEHMLQRRDLVNSTPGYWWYGSPVKPGLPLPGNFSGFAGTLAELNVPASNAFLTALLWFLIFIACLIGAMFLLKWGIESLAALHLVKTDRLAFFRKHWLWFTGAAVLRSFYIAFFMMMLLTMFQFTFGGSGGVKAIAAVVLVIFLLGLLCACGYALWYRTKSEMLPESSPQNDQEAGDEEKTTHSAWYKLGGKRSSGNGNPEGTAQQKTWLQEHILDLDSGRVHVHDDEKYTTRFGWLSGRFRRSKWWFFSFWLIYELVRAAFYGGAAGHALTQVFGLLAWEIISLVAIVLMRPFESNRLNLLMVYFLGFSKVATVALSSAFDPRFGLARIMTTVIGVIIIVIQGILTICLMIGILLGAVSSYMSITRYRETIKPRSLLRPRTRYFAHIDQKATDRPKPPPPAPPEPEIPKEPYFAVSTVRREAKIEDEHADHETQADHIPRPSMDPTYERHNQSHASRTQSMQSRPSMSNVPYGARLHRASWSTRDFQEMGIGQDNNPTHSRMSLESTNDAYHRHRAASLRAPSRNGTPLEALDRPSSGIDPQLRRSTHDRPISTPGGPKRNSSHLDATQENWPLEQQT